MAETSAFTFKHAEVVEALIKHHGLHEGIWQLHIKFGLAAANIGATGPETAELNPTALVPILEIGLQKTDKLSNIAADAAQVNPAAKKPRAKK